jgi:two-component sensor histidine kinase
MKNTLAMVQAIAMQTLKGVTDRDAVEAFRKRVHAISSAHDVLLRQNWLAAPMGEIVSSVLGTFKLEDRISISGPKVVFGPRATLSLSLLLHELATNAMKYGALSIDGGKVLVSWSIEIIDEIEQIKLEWIEHGGPAVKLPDGKGFGSRLIQMGLSGAGGAQMDYDEAGLRASFSAPLEDVMRA